MHLLSDEALFAAVQPSLSPAEAARLKQLNHAAGERSLTQAEVSEQAALLVMVSRGRFPYNTLACFPHIKTSSNPRWCNCQSAQV
jgi:hypothetical protein